MDTVAAHIEVTPGGKLRIAGHRITVQVVVIWHERLKMSAAEIASEYANQTAAENVE